MSETLCCEGDGTEIRFVVNSRTEEGAAAALTELDKQFSKSDEAFEFDGRYFKVTDPDCYLEAEGVCHRVTTTTKETTTVSKVATEKTVSVIKETLPSVVKPDATEPATTTTATKKLLVKEALAVESATANDDEGVRTCYF